MNNHIKVEITYAKNDQASVPNKPEPTPEEVKAALKGLGLPDTPEWVATVRKALLEKAADPTQPSKALASPTGQTFVKQVHDMANPQWPLTTSLKNDKF